MMDAALRLLDPVNELRTSLLSVERFYLLDLLMNDLKEWVLQVLLSL